MNSPAQQRIHWHVLAGVRVPVLVVPARWRRPHPATGHPVQGQPLGSIPAETPRVVAVRSAPVRCERLHRGSRPESTASCACAGHRRRQLPTPSIEHRTRARPTNQRCDRSKIPHPRKASLERFQRTRSGVEPTAQLARSRATCFDGRQSRVSFRRRRRADMGSRR